MAHILSLQKMNTDAAVDFFGSAEFAGDCSGNSNTCSSSSGGGCTITTTDMLY